MLKKAKAKAKKKKHLEHQETLYMDANDQSFGSQKSLNQMARAKAASSPKSGIPFAGAH